MDVVVVVVVVVVTGSIVRPLDIVAQRACQNMLSGDVDNDSVFMT